MLRILTLTLAAGFVSAALVAQANALPLSQGKTAAPEPADVTLVAQGCGPGFHRVRGRCVPMFVRPAPRCGRGWRWSERRGRCVRF
jgi:hypothetical protein